MPTIYATGTNTVANTGTSGNPYPAVNTSTGAYQFYNRTLLTEMEPKLVHLQFGDEYRMPENNGMIMNFRKLVQLDAKTDALTEGDPGDAQTLATTEVTVKLNQYGAYGEFTDLFDMANLDIGLTEKSEEFGRQGGLTIDHVVRSTLLSGITHTIEDASATLSSAQIRKAVRDLEKRKAERFDGYYIAIVSPDAIYDLQADDAWISAAKYQDTENVYTGEVGRLFGVRFVVTTEATETNSVKTIIIGRHCYGYTSWKGAHPRMIIKPAGSAGTADPLDQVSTVGWKMDGFGCAVLQPDYGVVITTALSA